MISTCQYWQRTLGLKVDHELETRLVQAEDPQIIGSQCSSQLLMQGKRGVNVNFFDIVKA